MKKTLWMLISNINQEGINLVLPTIAWIARETGVEFECYLEAMRSGTLFAKTGSTVIGGMHHQQFNYLNCVFDVKYIIFGEATVFRSSIDSFGCEVMVDTDDMLTLYDELLKRSGVKAEGILFAPEHEAAAGDNMLEISPYLYPEIYFRHMVAFSPEYKNQASGFIKRYDIQNSACIFLKESEKKIVGNVEEIDFLVDNDTYSTVTIRIAKRWKSRAKGVAFGDPAAIASMLPTLCREERIAVYGDLEKKSLSQIQTAWYTETKSEAADYASRLAVEVGNPVIIGRQTGDGDLFEWAKRGVCMQIMDPNRPAFPIVASVHHKWSNTKSIYEEEPDDATLERWAREGKILATVLWHSGEMAHNEAMLNLVELSCFTGVKMGIGVHAARYETLPQMWELIGVPREKGGVKGLIEPVLYSGGMGIMAEVNCPPELLTGHCLEAIKRIRDIAGDGAVPKGYQAFMDTDLGTLVPANKEIYEAVSHSGMEYYITCSVPGRNRILYDNGKCRVINQSCRTIVNASPFVRITTVEDLPTGDSAFMPGWVIGTLDAPVIAFNPYIWRHGSRFMRIVEWLQNAPNVVNVTPHVVARYAGILSRMGYLPDIG